MQDEVGVRDCAMFQLLEDFYTQAVRINLNAASQLAVLNPDHASYCAAAERGDFIVTVLQGDVYESVYVARFERIFETFVDAKSFYEHLILEHPDAAHYDFTVTSPAGAVAKTVDSDTLSKA